MKAEFEYSEEEVAAIMLAHHSTQFAAPAGKVWAKAIPGYASRAIRIEAVEKEPEGGAG